MKLLRRLLGRPSEDDFAEIMTGVLRRKGFEGPLKYIKEDFRLDSEGNRVEHFWLRNAYAEYLRASRKERGKVLDAFSGTLFEENETPDTFGEARPMLLPRIRQRGFYEISSLQMTLAKGQNDGVSPVQFPYRVFSEFLALGLAIDFPNTIKEGGIDQLEKWGVTLDQALEAATDNLWKISNGKFNEILPGLRCSPWSDTHDASRLVLTNLVCDLHVTGETVAMTPNRNVLLVTGSDDVNGLLAMAELGKKAYDDPRSISAIPVIHDGAGWAPFLPPAGHPAHGPLKELRYQTLLVEYSEQKAAWDAFNKKTNHDIFVGSYKVFLNEETKTLRSVSVLSDGVLTLLPKTDFVCFMQNVKGKLDMVAESRWEQVEAVFGSALEPTEMWPPRFRVARFPTPEQLNLLRGDMRVP